MNSEFLADADKIHFALFLSVETVLPVQPDYDAWCESNGGQTLGVCPELRSAMHRIEGRRK